MVGDTGGGLFGVVVVDGVEVDGGGVGVQVRGLFRSGTPELVVYCQPEVAASQLLWAQ